MSEYAESILDVGRLPLRRRDRAAMVLALECLRADQLHDAEAVLAANDDLAFYLHCSLPLRSRVPARLLRARLALLLRVLLRVDAGDYGKQTSVPAGPRCRRADHRRDVDSRCRVITCGCWKWVALPPLWEAAR